MSTRNKKPRRLGYQAAEPPVKEFNMLAAFRKGPLPPPAELEKYESLYPGATKLLFDNFINQTNHRMELENMVIREDNKRAKILAAILFIMGKDGVAIAAVFTAIAPIIIAFIANSISRQNSATFL
ncbi:MAG: DUF2335 domain-containing protein [Treponema sp.]|jgi:uncharacterized membrane protein|nr:DUF2335 domain-containing protein [Treponema sp.]